MEPPSPDESAEPATGNQAPEPHIRHRRLPELSVHSRSFAHCPPSLCSRSRRAGQAYLPPQAFLVATAAAAVIMISIIIASRLSIHCLRRLTSTGVSVSCQATEAEAAASCSFSLFNRPLLPIDPICFWAGAMYQCDNRTNTARIRVRAESGGRERAMGE